MYNESTGIIHMEWQNGSTLDIDLNVEKIPVSFSMDENGVITMTNADGTTYTADIGSLIKTYNFVDSDQIDFTATLQEDGSYSVTGTIKGGSITDAMIESGYLASVTAQASSASTSSQNATAKATLAESYAKGGTNTRTGEDTDNAKYYSDRASALVDVDIATTTKAGIVKPDGSTVTVDADGTIHSPGGHNHANKATLDSITEGDLLNWNAKADTVNIAKSGTSIYLNDAKAETIVGIKTYGKSIQNGTPTVGAPIPIVGAVNPKVIVNGKNLLKNTATSQTINGVTFTVNADKSVTVNGTANNRTAYIVKLGGISTSNMILNKQIILSGCPDGGANNTYWLQIWNDTSHSSINDYGQSAIATFTNTTTNDNIAIIIPSGYTCKNLTFKPMIRLASDTDSTYEPYTERSVTVSGTYRSVGDVKDVIDSVSGKIARKIGNIASYNNETITTDYISSTGALTTGANVHYVLPTPTEETIDSTTLTALRALTTYNPITNISNDKSCNMEVTYKSTSSVGLATTSVAGTVKPDGTTTTVDANGVITATAQAPDIATPLVAGIVKFDDETIGMDENNALYVIGGGQASGVAYSNTESGLSAENVQDAIDEVNDSLGGVQFQVVDGKLQFRYEMGV